MRDTAPIDILEALRGAPDFEAAATLTLRRLLGAAQAAAAAVPNAVVLRALLHLRPGAGYAGLYVLERGAEAVQRPEGKRGLLPSASVWRFVAEARRPAAVDVVRRQILPRGGPAQAATWREADDLSQATFRRLVDRESTHIYALPLLVGDALLGMVSVEASSFEAVGPEFVWPACAAELELIVALAAPWLARLPHEAPAAPPEVDALLPVVGPTMAPIVEVARAFAGEDETLLIHGETGTGKSRLARWVHARSPRHSGPFEVLDLLSVPEETQMGEIFGWRKGAFTGAVSDHEGFVARAEGGTLFIDEVDKLSLKAQAGLLLLLEERRYRALGDRGPARAADVRFVVGTNVDLRRAVEDGSFREDLFYRLDVLALDLPPLRQRKDEIGAWARYMLDRRRAQKDDGVRYRLSDAARVALEQQDWPGNLRQLDNVLRRACALASIGRRGDEVIVDAAHLAQRPAPGASGGGGTPLQQLDAGLAALARALAAPGGASKDGDVLPGALQGLLLAHLVDLTGERDAPFTLTGRPELVKNRNHHRALKRECQRAAALCAHLGEAPPPALAALLGGFD